MANYGAQYKPPSPAAIVRHGMTRRERLLVASRDRRYMTALVENYSADMVNEICRLCDRFRDRHG